MIGLRKRNRLLNLEKLLELSGATSIEEFREHFLHGIQERIRKDCLERQAKWTEAVAVGSEPFVKAMERRLRHRLTSQITAEDGAWVLQEEHGAVFGLIN